MDKELIEAVVNEVEKILFRRALDRKLEGYTV